MRTSTGELRETSGSCDAEASPLQDLSFAVAARLATSKDTFSGRLSPAKLEGPKACDKVGLLLWLKDNYAQVPFLGSAGTL